MPVLFQEQIAVEDMQLLGCFHTHREIVQQPETWHRTFALFASQAEAVQRFLERTGVRDPLGARPVVWLIGAGTSDYIGKSLALLLRARWGCEVAVVSSTELLPNIQNFVVPGQRALWISFSRSGDSPEGVAVLQRAAEFYPEIRHIVVTCNRQGAMFALAEADEHSMAIALEDEVNDRSLVMTSSFTNMIVLGQCLAHAWSLEEYRAVAAKLVAAGQAFLPRAARLAEQVADCQGICYLGSGSLAGSAQEAALKALEMTAGQVPSSWEGVLGFRHGPMAALHRDTLLVCSASGDAATAGYAHDLLEEIRRKDLAGKTIAIGPARSEDWFRPVVDHYLGMEIEVDDLYRPVLDILFGQMLGFFCSLRHHLKPDSPSASGTINRVVGQFPLY